MTETGWLANAKSPRYGTAGDDPSVILRIDPDGTETLGKFDSAGNFEAESPDASDRANAEILEGIAERNSGLTDQERGHLMDIARTLRHRARFHGKRPMSGSARVYERLLGVARTWLLPDDMAALQRFYETCEDNQPYDVPKDRMKRLAELGVIQWHGAARYSITAFGQHVLDLLPEGWPRLPLKTHADHDAHTNAAIKEASGDVGVNPCDGSRS
jgi:hypothetical protein